MWCRERLRWWRLWWWWRTATATATASCHRHRHCCCWWQQQQRQQQHRRHCFCHHHAEEAKTALVAAKTKAGDDTEKYFDLVSIAHGPGRGEHPSPLAKKYRAEIEKLKCVRDGEWHHGFNSGMLAASHMYTGLAMSTEEEACIQFYDDSVEEGDFVGLRLAAHRGMVLDEFPELSS